MSATMAKLTVPYHIRLPVDLSDRIDRRMAVERRSSRSEMVRILIEDGLAAREAQNTERPKRKPVISTSRI